jgi:hypothetical protein
MPMTPKSNPQGTDGARIETDDMSSDILKGIHETYYEEFIAEIYPQILCQSVKGAIFPAELPP